MHLTHIVIDDFLADPESIRKTALGLVYPPRHEADIYPGRNANQALAFPGIENLIGEIVHEQLTPQTGTSHGRPRLAQAGDKGEASVHIDMNYWSAMVYLSRDEDCREGTHFFRHKKTGWDMAPAFPGMAEQAGYLNADDALKDILKENGRDSDAWEHRMTIPMKFNRLAIFRGYLWHDAGVSFGTNPEDSRLVLPFFFDNLDQN